MYRVGSIPGYSHKHYTCIQIFGMTDPQNNMRSKFNRLTQVNFTVNFFKSEFGHAHITLQWVYLLLAKDRILQ